MTTKFEALSAQELLQNIQQFSKERLDSPYNGKITCFETIDSTNAWLLANGGNGDFCLSETQTAGRGRRNNEWVSPDSGNIYLSFCCYFNHSVEHRSLLGLVAGVAIAEALDEIGLKDHGIKWPNDIFWKGQKLGGILIQTAENYEKFIIGIGLNVCLPDKSLEKITQTATSLEQALTDQKLDREKIVTEIMKRLLSYIEVFPQLPFHVFLKEWNRWDILHGKTVSFEHQNNEISGLVNGIDRHGRIGIIIEKPSIDKQSDNVKIQSLESKVDYFSVADIKLSKSSIRYEQK